MTKEKNNWLKESLTDIKKSVEQSRVENKKEHTDLSKRIGKHEVRLTTIEIARETKEKAKVSQEKVVEKIKEKEEKRKGKLWVFLTTMFFTLLAFCLGRL